MPLAEGWMGMQCKCAQACCWLARTLPSIYHYHDYTGKINRHRPAAKTIFDRFPPNTLVLCCSWCCWKWWRSFFVLLSCYCCSCIIDLWIILKWMFSVMITTMKSTRTTTTNCRIMISVYSRALYDTQAQRSKWRKDQKIKMSVGWRDNKTLHIVSLLPNLFPHWKDDDSNTIIPKG